MTSHYPGPLTTLVTTELHRNYDIAEQRGGWQMKFSRPKSKQATYFCEERRETRVNFAVKFNLIISFPLVRKRIDLNDAQQKIVLIMIMRLVPVFILETYNPTNNECLPKFVQWDNTSSRIKTAILSYHRPRWTNRTTYLLRHANLLLILRLSLILLTTSHTGTVHII